MPYPSWTEEVALTTVLVTHLFVLTLITGVIYVRLTSVSLRGLVLSGQFLSVYSDILFLLAFL